MNDSHSEHYKAAGVDITAGYEAVKLMKPYIERTRIPGVLGGVGGFGGLFEPDMSGMKRPVFVSGTDGVGTKLKIAFLMDKHDTVGIDCVAMCVNDVVCAGARPLFFLDYIAVGKNYPERVAALVKGVTEGCVQAGCALVGGETAEMPGFYPKEEYDIAGFSVGMVDFEKIIDGKSLAAGDILIGLPSSGVHSNGFSLVRKALRVREENITQYVPSFGKTLGEELLTPTRIYVKPMLDAIAAGGVHGVSHVTGGGFYENLPRMLPDGVRAKVERAALPVLPVFDMIAESGEIDTRDMFNTFNMGIGMVAAVARDSADGVLAALRASGEDARVIGECVSGETGIDIL